MTFYSIKRRPLVYNPQWNRRIRSIAYQFHRPDLRISTDTIGWDPQDGEVHSDLLLRAASSATISPVFLRAGRAMSKFR